MTQKTAWHLGHRIRAVLQEGGLLGFERPLEVDETCIGGEAGNMYTEKRAELVSGRGVVGKTPVVGVKDRISGRVAAESICGTDADTLTGFVESAMQSGVEVFTDGRSGYDKLGSKGLLHDKVIHTDGENMCLR